MPVKKIYSDYQSENLRDLPWLQAQLAELNTEEYYIAQRDSYNKQQKDEWNEKKENLRKYTEKYNETIVKYIFSPSQARYYLLDHFRNYEIYKILGIEPYSFSDTLTHPEKINVPLNPKDIKLPDEPIPVTDLQPFKDATKEEIQTIRQSIEKLKAETANDMSQSDYEPLPLGYDRWLYQNAVYEVTGGHSDEEKKLLILEFADKDRRKFERLKNKFSGKKSDEVKYERTRIPEEVRIAVWRRDQGRCARCASRENLEYDHIVPVSKGGGNTERNIELLCQDCNRAKSNRIE